MAARLGRIKQQIILRLSNEFYISFALFPQASEPGVNFYISKLVYGLLRVLTTEGVMCSLLAGQPS